MKRLLSILILFTLFLSAQSYEILWKEVQQFESKSLPKSALKSVNSIYTKAKNEKDETQFIKSLLYKEKFLLQLNEDGYVKVISDIENAIKESPKEGTKLILYSILAQMYGNYLDRNYYRINQRTELKEDSSTDIRTWSIDKLYKKASQLYLKSLDKVAGDIKIDNYKDILEKGVNVDDIQPTLYDFLAFRALKYFKNSRTALNKKGTFRLQDSDVFSSAYTFMYLSFPSSIREYPEYQALVIYQELLKLHKSKKNINALDYVTVERLNFVYKNFIHKNKEKYYIKALKNIVKRDLDSQAILYLAKFYYNKGNYKEAMPYIELALKSSNRYVIANVKSIKNSIKAKHLQFQTERVNLPNENILSRVDYRNGHKLFVRVIELNKNEKEKLNHKRKYNEKIEYIKTLYAFKNLKIKLPKTDDYKQHSTEVSLDNYPTGEYLFVLSFSKKLDEHAVYKIVPISNIAYIKQGTKKLIVTHRKTGEPLENVEVSFYEKRYNRNIGQYERELYSKKRTNRDGKVTIPNIKNNFDMTFKYKKDFLDLRDNNYYNSYERKSKPYTTTFVNFFTDRAIYRPNQTIYFKGLALNRSTNKAPEILKNIDIKVSFYNTNHQLIESKIFKTNEFGTFNGEFIAPKSGLLGSMYIKANLGGNKRVQVEEYKQPKFEVTFKKLEKSYKIGDTIEVKGEAKAYAGNGLENATVKYRVTRLASFPWIPYWRHYKYRSYEETIHTGTVKTDRSGEFKVVFDALADEKLDKKDRPNYSYTISVDITDTTGETHSVRKIITLGYVGIKLNIKIDKELSSKTNNELTINSTNLDGKFQPLEGEIYIEKFLKEPKVYRKRYWQEAENKLYSEEEFRKLFENYKYSKKRDNQEKELIRKIKFNTQTSKEVLLDDLEQGEYLLTIKSFDQKGEEISTSKKITIYDLESNTPPISTYLWIKSDKKEYEVPTVAKIYLKSLAEDLFLLLTIEREGKVSKERWIKINKLKEELIKISKKDRGNIHYKLNFIRNNRIFHKQGTLVVPWDSKLNIELISFRDKLKPNEKEQWKLKISGKNREKVVAEMVATMYDASLDQFMTHQFSIPYLFPIYSHNYTKNWESSNFRAVLAQCSWQKNQKERFQRRFPRLKWLNMNRRVYYHESRSRMGGGVKLEEEMVMPSPVIMATPPMPKALSFKKERKVNANAYVDLSNKAKVPNKKRTTTRPIHVRKNFNETMFFKPNLQTDKDGNIIINFKSNEALTRWNFIGFAHSKELRTGTINKTLSTTKELMVVTNLPRFFREKDNITLSAKVVNMSSKDLDAECELQLVDPISQKPIYNKEFKKFVHIKKGSSSVVNFNIKIPNIDKVSAIQHTLIARTATHTDAEQVIKPILSNRVFITESKVLWVKANQEKSFTLESLKNNNSKTLKNHLLTLEFTSNPAWYAIQSLPYLMEYEHECSEQLFSRYYANTLAQNIANKTPKIKAIFDEWRAKGELKSKLSTNQNLKSVLLEETPWVLEAQSQEQQQQNIALLFDMHKLASEQKKALEKLQKRQLSKGGWSWFGGNHASWYITQYIVEGMGHLKALGVENIENKMISKAIKYIDQKIVQEYNELLKLVEDGYRKIEDDNLNSMIIHYLYARSFYTQNMSNQVEVAHKYYLEQAKKYWTSKGIYEKGMIALALNRLGEDALDIVASLKEHSIQNDELGTYFKYVNGYYWNELPIETHSLMIEVFETITKDRDMVEKLKIWLLKQRQTSYWKTTKATSSAIYALLSNNNWLDSDKLVNVTFKTSKSYQAKLKEAQSKSIKGLGYYKVTYKKDEFDKSMGTIKVSNPNPTIAWGGLYWKYFEDMDRVKTFKETPLTIDKKLFLIEQTNGTEQLSPIENQVLKVGNKVKVRVEIRVDRNMEYIMLKDSRASTFEPINVISQYKYQDGLGYYQSTKDNATYFFIDYLPKGTYVFEYPLLVTHKGIFSNGITTMESMYAPEFKSHSEGVRIFVE